MFHGTSSQYLHLEPPLEISAKNTQCQNNNFYAGPQHRNICNMFTTKHLCVPSAWEGRILLWKARHSGEKTPLNLTQQFFSLRSQRYCSEFILWSSIQTASLTYLMKDVLGIRTGHLSVRKPLAELLMLYRSSCDAELLLCTRSIWYLHSMIMPEE